MCLAFKPLALDLGLSKEILVVSCVNFGRLTTHMPTSTCIGSHAQVAAILPAGVVRIMRTSQSLLLVP